MIGFKNGRFPDFSKDVHQYSAIFILCYYVSMDTLDNKNIDLIRVTVAETINVLMSDPDFGLQLKPSFKEEVAKRLKNLSKSKLISFSKIKSHFANA